MANNKLNKAMEKLSNYREYAQHTDCYVTPEKGTNSGSDGRLFEMAVKMCLNNYRFNGVVANNGCIDTTKTFNGKKHTFEIKSGCGTIAILDEKGNIKNSELLKSEYVIYCPEYFNDSPVSYQAFVFPVNTFLMVLNDCGLLRYKYSGLQYEFTKDGTKKRKANAYHDKLTIQTFKNSKRKTDLFYSMIEEYGTRLDTFCIKNNIKFNKEA